MAQIGNLPNYEVIKELGKGSFATVLLCKKTGTDQLFAMKSFSKSMLRNKKQYVEVDGKMTTETELNKIYKEIALMKKVHHVNCVNMYEVIDEQDSDQLYMALEYVEKGQIMDFNGEKKRYFNNTEKGVYDENTAKILFADMVAGIRYLHNNGIVHCDIKPENILVTKDDHCKIADFGVSQIVSEYDKQGSRRGMLTAFTGTTQFCAPECYDQDSFSGYLVDVYALGVTLYIMIYGDLPFYSENINELIDMICDAEVKYPENISTSKELNDLLRQMLEKDPNKRITVGGIINHPWLSEYKEEIEKKCTDSVKIEVTDEEIANAITKAPSSHIKLKIDKRLNEIRGNLKEKEKEKENNTTSENKEEEKEKEETKKSEEVAETQSTTETIKSDNTANTEGNNNNNNNNNNDNESVTSMKRQQSVISPRQRVIRKLPEPAEYHGTMKKLCNKKCCRRSWEDRFVNLNCREFAYKKLSKPSQTVFLLSDVQRIRNMPSGTTSIMIETRSKTIHLRAQNVAEAQRFMDAYRKIKAQK